MLPYGGPPRRGQSRMVGGGVLRSPPFVTYVGYITGVIWASPDDGCPPAGTNFGEMTLVVISYLKRNSAQLHRAAGYLVEEALREAWPCPK